MQEKTEGRKREKADRYKTKCSAKKGNKRGRKTTLWGVIFENRHQRVRKEWDGGRRKEKNEKSKKNTRVSMKRN